MSFYKDSRPFSGLFAAIMVMVVTSEVSLSSVLAVEGHIACGCLWVLKHVCSLQENRLCCQSAHVEAGQGSLLAAFYYEESSLERSGIPAFISAGCRKSI